MFNKSIFFVIVFCCLFGLNAQSQPKDTPSLQAVNQAIESDIKSASDNLPVISYTLSPKKYEIADIKISGLSNPIYEDYVLIGFSNLAIGDKVEIPGSDITNAVKRFWKQGLFSDVMILATKIDGNKIWLEINLKDRPRISEIDFPGIKKGEKQDLEGKIGVVKGSQITPNMLDRAKSIIKKYYDEKGFNNAIINISQEDDLSKENHVILKINVNKKDKIKVHSIDIDGNIEVSDNTLERAMKKTKHKSTTSAKIHNFLRTTNYVNENYEADKENLLEKYNELGYRDAQIMWDTVYRYNDKKVNIKMKIDEGKKYHLRNINWVGNTEFSTNQLQTVFGMKPGDVYNQKKMRQRLNDDDDAVGNIYYYNNGYIFYQADPVEINIENDSIDLEIRIVEGPKASIRRVSIAGNDRLYEDVVRRELRTKPGALFSKEDLMRSLREIAQMGHFDPENLQPDVAPDPETGTVDIGYNLVSKANDQVEFSAGWGQTGVIGKLSLRFTNFSLSNLFNRGSYKGIIPQGEGQSLTLSGQTNGRYYQSYSISFMDPWFGGKRPNMLSAGAFFAIQTDVNSRFFNNNSYNPYQSLGMGNSTGGYDYNRALDPNKSFKTLGLSVGYGKRLNWPDDYFQFQAELSYQMYKLRDWEYLYPIRNGTSNNLSLNFTLSRNSIDNPIYTRRGTTFSLGLRVTPPFSLWDNKDYANMKTDDNGYVIGDKFRWIEYHKWMFKSKTFTSLMPSVTKTPVLMTRAEFGLLGYFNTHKRSPFETYYVGGDGMSGSSSNYATETIGLRGYENGSLGRQASAYTRMALELRYPLILEPSSTIYILSFVEAGNAWNDVKEFNPFLLKRSAGFGARIMLPMIGLMGIDWAYGFDKIGSERGGGRFHFVIGQEF